MRIVHIRVNWYTASNPCDTDCDKSAANSWLLNIFKLQPVYWKGMEIVIHSDFMKKTMSDDGMTRLMNLFTRWYFAYCGWMPAISLIAIRALNKYTRIAQTFGKHLTANVIETDAFADVSPGLLDHFITIHIR